MAEPNQYISDFVTRLRTSSRLARDAFFTTSALRKEATALGYIDTMTPDDLAGSNSDLDVVDILHINQFYDSVDTVLAAHPEQFQALLKLARKTQ